MRTLDGFKKGVNLGGWLSRDHLTRSISKHLSQKKILQE